MSEEYFDQNESNTNLISQNQEKINLNKELEDIQLNSSENNNKETSVKENLEHENHDIESVHQKSPETSLEKTNVCQSGIKRLYTRKNVFSKVNNEHWINIAIWLSFICHILSIILAISALSSDKMASSGDISYGLVSYRNKACVPYCLCDRAITSGLKAAGIAFLIFAILGIILSCFLTILFFNPVFNKRGKIILIICTALKSLLWMILLIVWWINYNNKPPIKIDKNLTVDDNYGFGASSTLMLLAILFSIASTFLMCKLKNDAIILKINISFNINVKINSKQLSELF